MALSDGLNLSRWQNGTMAQMFHVSSSSNRQSIMDHGLNWRLMGATRGIAGSRAPEQEGCFLCLDESEVDWFVRMNNTGGTVDVWAVDGIESQELVRSGEGHFYIPTPIPPSQLSLVRKDIAPVNRR